MQSEGYRECLISSVNNLADIRQMIFDSMVPMAMQGELKEWSDSVPVGEEHFISKELLGSLEDINVQHLMRLMKKVDETIETLMNSNNLSFDDEKH